MKAVVIDCPHSARLIETETPKIREGDVLVRVQSVGICMSDVEILEGTRPQPYIKYPGVTGYLM